MALWLPKQPIYWPKRELDAQFLERYWQSVEEAKAALALPKPSLFLGGNQRVSQKQERPSSGSAPIERPVELNMLT
jgi:hypothetical protein